MNKYKTNISILSVCFLICSCEGFLDRTDPTVLVSDNFYQTEEQVEQAVNGVYGQLQPIISNQWQYNEFITDNTTLHFNEANRGQGPALEALEFWQINPSTTNITSLYNSIYGALANINTTLSKLPESNASDAVKDRSEGELKFIRAYYYFLLVQYFGEVIIVTEPLSSPGDAYAYERQPVESIYQLIVTDLDFAASTLPPSYDGANTGRATKGAALSLLGKVYLTRKEYAQAISTLDSVLTVHYYLLPNYADVFRPNKNHQVESIFAIQFQRDSQLVEYCSFIYTLRLCRA